MLVEGCSGQVLGQHVGGVPRTKHLKDAEVASPNSFLNPELAHSEVSYFTYPGPLDDPEGRTGVRVELQQAGDAEVQEQGAKAKGFRSPFDHACQLCLPAG